MAAGQHDEIDHRFEGRLNRRGEFNPGRRLSRQRRRIRVELAHRIDQPGDDRQDTNEGGDFYEQQRSIGDQPPAAELAPCPPTESSRDLFPDRSADRFGPEAVQEHRPPAPDLLTDRAVAAAVRAAV